VFTSKNWSLIKALKISWSYFSTAKCIGVYPRLSVKFKSKICLLCRLFSLTISLIAWYYFLRRAIWIGAAFIWSTRFTSTPREIHLFNIFILRERSLSYLTNKRWTTLAPIVFKTCGLQLGSFRISNAMSNFSVSIEICSGYPCFKETLFKFSGKQLLEVNKILAYSEVGYLNEQSKGA